MIPITMFMNTFKSSPCPTFSNRHSFSSYHATEASQICTLALSEIVSVAIWNVIPVWVRAGWRSGKHCVFLSSAWRNYPFGSRRNKPAVDTWKLTGAHWCDSNSLMSSKQTVLLLSFHSGMMEMSLPVYGYIVFVFFHVSLWGLEHSMPTTTTTTTASLLIASCISVTERWWRSVFI